MTWTPAAQARHTNGPTPNPAATVVEAMACSSPPGALATNASTSAASRSGTNSSAVGRRATSPVPGPARAWSSRGVIDRAGAHAELQHEGGGVVPAAGLVGQLDEPIGGLPAASADDIAWRIWSSSSWRWTPSVHSSRRSPDRTGTASTSIRRTRARDR